MLCSAGEEDRTYYAAAAVTDTQVVWQWQELVEHSLYILYICTRMTIKW